MSLHDFWQRIKPQPGSNTEEVEFNEEGRVERFPLLGRLYLSLVIILLATLSFGLGRLSVVGRREPVRIEYDPSISNDQFLISNQSPSPSDHKAQSASAIQALGQGSVVASKNGSKYHYEHCPGAKQIKEANKVTFASAAAAEAAGYTLAANCKLR